MSTSVVQEEPIIPQLEIEEEVEVQQSEPSEELQNILAVQDYEEQKLAEELKVEQDEPEEQKQEIEIETSEEELKMREEEVKTHILAKGDDLQEFDKALEEEKKFIG